MRTQTNCTGTLTLGSPRPAERREHTRPSSRPPGVRGLHHMQSINLYVTVDDHLLGRRTALRRVRVKGIRVSSVAQLPTSPEERRHSQAGLSLGGPAAEAQAHGMVTGEQSVFAALRTDVF